MDICMCGLSGNQPFFCDGSHKKMADEAAGKVYVYHEDGTRKEVSDASRG
jgi:CDGSH-type Zn-finger protein